MARADRPAWSSTVAVVLRSTWLVTWPKPASEKAARRSACVLEGSRQPPSGAANTGVSAPAPSSEALERAALLRNLSTHQGGRSSVRATEAVLRSEEHTSELQSRHYLVCRLLLEKKKRRPVLI